MTNKQIIQDTVFKIKDEVVKIKEFEIEQGIFTDTVNIDDLNSIFNKVVEEDEEVV